MTNPNDDLVFEPVHELAAKIGAGKLTSLELLEAYLERVRHYDERLHAFVDVYEDSARTAAQAADEARGTKSLAGIPIALKDLLDIEGRTTKGGSEYFAERISKVTATLVTRLETAGVYALGKTHTVEFAMGGWGTNQHLGTPRNPWDADTHRAPGGSSSGSGVAVAAGLAPWAIGTDTGGSVRLPSSWCGLTGLKTTVGRVSTFGVLPLSTTLDTPGPMCRCVEDAAQLFTLLQGVDDHDPRTKLVPPGDVFATLEEGVDGLTLGRLADPELDAVEPEVLAAYETSITTLEKQGAKVVEVSLPVRLHDMIEMTMQIIAAEGYSFYGSLVDDPTLPLDDAVRPRIGLGRDILAKDYLMTLRDREGLKQSFAESLSHVDALLTPTTATTAPVVESIDQTQTPAMFTRPANLLDGCALALPNGITEQGLPSSLQIMCAGYEEAMALRIGRAYQRETDWHTRRPNGVGPSQPIEIIR